MNYTYKHPHPAVTTDIVVFTMRHDELEVLLVKRALPPYRNLWALPGGFVNLEESLEAGARRELEEETGYRAGEIVPLGAFAGSSGISNERFHLFLASQLSADGRIRREPTEQIELELIPLVTLESMALAGEIEDAPSALAILLASRLSATLGSDPAPDGSWI